MKEILEDQCRLLREFGKCNPAISYEGDPQSYCGIVDCFNLDGDKLSIYFKWIIIRQKSSERKLFIHSFAVIEKSEVSRSKDDRNTLIIKYSGGIIRVTNRLDQKFAIMQERTMCDKSNHH